ncbi:DNA helicase/exodeoxyribonuclease V, gamma subunit [Colwellia chukchiensis]|uniref:RecBCD enzyme subunit RecC n=1 Tax=Colwellia chukchiensis TaxID=641665 RepID=A0A1H7KP59_9GAMM|nr:exodeoxyribonuclease V subunit gamma [Colwellia chukchiensis]SEK87835.1 DNA helicase/exodeoxyribonuclease V, gamma subunit [Colwellia chukchiensis]
MFYLYPANKMENLLVLLDKIQQLSPLPVFAQDTVIVQNAGMQHWLNMSLAKQRGISMNMRYALPSQFLWHLIRSLASEQDVPEQSPFSREVMTWRIDTLLASAKVLKDDSFNVASDYWRENQATEQAFTETEQLKRYQLACQLADLYEQYLIFRPEWIHAWHQGEFNAYDQVNSASTTDNQADQKLAAQSNAIWQGKLWHLLVQEQSYDPQELVELAIKNLHHSENLSVQALPERISFFGINAMAPLWLEFINALSQKIDVHFFHLNPCYAYWGDVVTEKNAIEAWLKGTDFSAPAQEHTDDQASDLADINLPVGNPLLANLGQQGREFMALLYQYSTINIEVFESALSDLANAASSSTVTDTATEANHALQRSQANVLACVQQDILSLSDARQQQINSAQEPAKIDGSIIITSAHSALREVQGLHDWLLHQFNQDPSLTPKDVLVMCPQVEQYAPYVNAVFTRGWQDIGDEVPPLPCSIADRVSKDAEPLVAAFAQLLSLPDSRFQVSSLIALLRLPAMQARFAINLDDIEKITQWLDIAAVHWGLDQAHKQQVLAQSHGAITSNVDPTRAELDNVSDSFTWQQGLSRLMRGFAFADHSVIYQNQLLLPTIEGSDSELLGKLMLIIEQLQLSAVNMAKARSAQQWQLFLFELLAQLFDDDNDNGLAIIRRAIESLVEYCQHANYSQHISLAVIRDFLNSHFSQPDPGRQFMVGQVTFCSMLPMRSIPFKIIAVLGLNDGEFPRQRQPLSFDLMTTTAAKLGDRSRRGDDRYLFLEAIISARQALYLSYQGKNINNNKDRQPSLVLKELMEYLARGYGWPLLGLNQTPTACSANQVRQLPMQAFSEHNYRGAFASFDANWLNLARAGKSEANHDIKGQAQPQTQYPNASREEQAAVKEQDNLLSSELIRFYQHPSRYYAQQVLNLYLDSRDTLINDVEPFVPNRLDSYLLRQDLLNYYLAPEQSRQSCEDILLTARLAGSLPDLPSTDALIAGWQADSETFSQFIRRELAQPGAENAALSLQPIDCRVSLNLADFWSSNLAQPSTDGTTLFSAEQLAWLKPLLPKTLTLHTKLTLVHNKAVLYRSSSAKAKDLFSLYLQQLMVQVAQTQAKSAEVFVDISASHGYYFDTKSQTPSEVYFTDIDDAKGQLLRLVAMFYLGQGQPLLLNAELAEKVQKSKVFEQAQLQQFWTDSNSFQTFGAEPYINYFWPQCPDYQDITPKLFSIYQPMFAALKTVKAAAKTSANSGAKA